MQGLLDVLCRVVLAVLSSYHIVTGVVSVGFPDFSEHFYKRLYHFHPEMTEQYKLVLRPWGALALFAGIAGLFAATDPDRYYGLVLAITLLLGLRVSYRTMLAAKMQAVFQIDARRNRANTAIILIEISVLTAWLWTHRGAL